MRNYVKWIDWWTDWNWPIAGNVENVQFGAISQLVGQKVQFVVTQWQNVEADETANIDGQIVQPIAVHVQIR